MKTIFLENEAFTGAGELFVRRFFKGLALDWLLSYLIVVYAFCIESLRFHLINVSGFY